MNKLINGRQPVKWNAGIGALLMFLLGTSAIEFPDTELDNTTDDALTLLSTTEVPDTESDNGMALGSIPDQLTTGDVIQGYELEKDAGIDLAPSVFPAAEFPENHKNYTNTPLVSSIELPPLLNQFNAYQEQYKAYYKQKDEFKYKPIKFETNSASNHYVTSGLSAHLEDNDARHKYEEFKYQREPFPYTYENERLPYLSQSLWSSHAESQPIENDISYAYYQPYGDKQEIHATHKDNDHSSWKKALKFFTALVPLGLLLATFTPSVISINSTVDAKPIRQRSMDDKVNFTGEDFKEYFKREYGMDATGNSECQKRAICDLSRAGKEDSSNYMQKGFWYLANRTPDEVAEELGLRELFHAIRGDNCQVYKCQQKKDVVQRVVKKRRKKLFPNLKI